MVLSLYKDTSVVGQIELRLKDTKIALISIRSSFVTKSADPQLWALSGSSTRRLSRLTSIAEVNTGILGVAIISSSAFYASGYPFLAEARPIARRMPMMPLVTVQSHPA